ncbi:MAG: DUF721 domain-containing protein [Planctomycetota bacterium]|nr:DUF721 domain-containing protein [Planctomycetota bacterium]
MAANPRRADAVAGPVSIGRVMARLMSRAGYDRERSTAALESAWSAAVPEAIRSSRPGLVRRGVLEVFVSHSAHVQELGFHKQAIVSRLRELLPDAGVSDIRCRIRPDAGHGS